MNLFAIENNVVVFSPQALLIKPFKKIWDMDKTKNKEMAPLWLGYIYYMADDRSDFIYILDLVEREEEIKKFLGLEIDWDGQTPEMMEAINFYMALSETTSTKLLRSTRGILEKISSYMDNINMNERDERTKKPIHDISKITASVEKVPKLVKALNEIEKEVIKEKELKTQNGSGSAAMFEEIEL